MQNIEIKARCQDLAAARLAVEQNGAVFTEVLLQKDTYFRVSDGRLKLREIDGQQAQLIFYARPDEPGPKTCDYQIYPVENASALGKLLEGALGIWTTVEKTRTLFMCGEVRIHLDTVKGLGDFIELEGVLFSGSTYSAVHSKVRHFLTILNISEADYIRYSYSDLMTK
jgi:predicted adenylyl cyclase CyaB